MAMQSTTYHKTSLPSKPQHENIDIRFQIEGFHEKLYNNLYSMWNTSQLCDLTLRLSGGNEILVHSCLLAAFSPTVADILAKVDAYFYEKEEISQKHVIINVKRFSVHVMKAIISLMYTGKFQLVVTSALVLNQLLEASRWLKIEKLITILQKYVREDGFSRNSANTNLETFVPASVLTSDGSVIFNIKSNNISKLENGEEFVTKSSSSSLLDFNHVAKKSLSIEKNCEQNLESQNVYSSKSSSLGCAGQSSSINSSSEIDVSLPPLEPKNVNNFANTKSTKSSSTDTCTGTTFGNEMRGSNLKRKRSQNVVEARLAEDNFHEGMINDRSGTEFEMIPEIKMEVDNLSDFLSSCDESSVLNVGHLNEESDIRSLHLPGCTGSLGVESIENRLDDINEIKKEDEDEDLREVSFEVASFLSSYVDNNYSLIHDHIYFNLTENNENDTVNTSDGDKNGNDKVKNKIRSEKTDRSSRTPRQKDAGLRNEEDMDLRNASISNSFSSDEINDQLTQANYDDVENPTTTSEVTVIMCSKCGASFTNETELKDHTDNHPVFSCTECPAKFYHKLNLIRHTNSLHTVPLSNLEWFYVQFRKLKQITSAVYNKPTPLGLRMRRLKCPECSHIAETTAALCRHSTLEHGQPKPFKCDRKGCRFRSNKNYSMINHIKTTHAVGKKVTCENCNVSLKNAATYRTHRRSCLKLGEYLCDICGKSFLQQQYLALHRETIHGRVKKHKCDKCTRVFSCHANLKRHLRIHNNAFPYSCSKCGKRFRHSNTLKSHKEAVHRD